jgi:Transposase IS116/IS110/IS902 family
MMTLPDMVDDQRETGCCPANELDGVLASTSKSCLAPGQYSSGGKTRLGRITKAGDAYPEACSCWVPGRCPMASVR